MCLFVHVAFAEFVGFVGTIFRMALKKWFKNGMEVFSPAHILDRGVFSFCVSESVCINGNEMSDFKVDSYGFLVFIAPSVPRV
jgi:hypothetical protein